MGRKRHVGSCDKDMEMNWLICSCSSCHYVQYFLQKVSFDEDALLTAYKRFFEINHDKEDAVERLLNIHASAFQLNVK